MESSVERLLLIDDDIDLCEMVTEYLVVEGFAVEALHDGAAGAARATAGEHALVVLDVMLPGMNGFDVLRQIRAAPGPAARLPVLMLTARGDAVDRVVGLELGADDYLAKPFHSRELVARVRAILRRARPAADDAAPPREKLAAGDIDLDSATRTVRRGGVPVELTTLEFDLLAVLLRAVGKVVTREQIIRDIFGRKWTNYDRSVDMHISNLRRKLGRHPDGSERIKTVRSAGYILTPPGG